jgi:hypothetical protein
LILWDPENEPDAISLAISDHLAWGENTNDHLYKLQEKINSYIEFIESGQMEESFPKAKGKQRKLLRFTSKILRRKMFCFSLIKLKVFWLGLM